MDTRRRTTPLFLAAALVLVLGAACKNSIQSQVNNIGGTPLSEGTAHVDISGATELSFDAPLDKAQVGTAVTVFLYKNDKDDLFSVTGLGINGTAKTSGNLALTVTSGDFAADSLEGECTITVTPGDNASQSGTATCTDLDSNQGKVDVKATFSANA
jgi:hypothetical protein